jgi:hypothetical protein
VSRRFASAMVLLAALAPPAAHAQVNIDQGKAPAQIYDSDCAACHKSMRGLANGRSAAALTSFLAEHYTSSAKQASALAAYVLAGGGGVGTPAPTRPPKTKPDTTSASAEEPKDHDAKRAGKPEVERGTGPKSQRPSATSAKPDGEQQTVVTEPGKPAPSRREPNPGAGTRTRVQAPPPPAPTKPTTVVVVPSPPETPSPTPTPPASEPPAESQLGADAPVPRDNIPD